jgi:hypothetical protein
MLWSPPSSTLLQHHKHQAQKAQEDKEKTERKNAASRHHRQRKERVSYLVLVTRLAKIKHNFLL